MLATVIRVVAIVASLLVVAGFVLFARDELSDASLKQQDAVTDIQRPSNLDPVDERARERRHSSAREVVDDANDVLLRPFDGVIDSESEWATRGVPALLALLIYGVGLGFLARTLQGRL